MKHICFVNFGPVINSVGGAEKVLVSLANELTLKGYQVTIVVCEDKDGLPYYRLNKEVQFVNLRCNQNINFYMRVLRKFCKLVHFDYRYLFNKKNINIKLEKILKNENIDVIINFFPQHLNYVFCNKFNDTPVIQMLHGSIDWLNNFFAVSKDITYKKRLNGVDYIQVLMPSYVNTLSANYTVPIKCISNIVPLIPQCIYTKKVVLLARFDKEDKRNHLLIEAYSQIAELFPDWEMHIYGMKYTAGYMEECESLIRKLNLSHKCFIHTPIDNVEKVLKDASIFALPSRYEGFCLALTEAMSAGLSCVAYKSCAGVNELIIDGYNGFLVEDGVNDFAKKLSLLMNDKELCRIMGLNARNSVQKYSKDVVVSKWIDLIEQVCLDKMK